MDDLDKALLRLASADSDESLSTAVNRHLPSVLRQLNSTQEGVRKKVMELLVHLNKRVKDNPAIPLPIHALLELYSEPSSNTFVVNFTVIYLKMGFNRLKEAEKIEIAPDFLLRAEEEGKPQSHKDSIFHMILPVLDKMSSVDILGKNFNAFLFDYLIQPYGMHPSNVVEPDMAKVHPGLSESGWKRVSGESPIKADQLEKNRAKITKFLGQMTDVKSVAVHLALASSDSRHSVAAAADSELRRLASSAIDWNDAVIVADIYKVFLGDKASKRLAANTRMRLKLMPFLLKSRKAAESFPSCIQTAFDLLFGNENNTNAKLKVRKTRVFSR